jgi:hypothetical protein
MQEERAHLLQRQRIDIPPWLWCSHSLSVSCLINNNDGGHESSASLMPNEWPPELRIGAGVSR